MTHLGEEEDLVEPMCLVTIFDGFTSEDVVDYKYD